MSKERLSRRFPTISLGDYGMLIALLALCLLFSLLTLKRQAGTGPAAETEMVGVVLNRISGSELALIVGASNTDSEILARNVYQQVIASGRDTARLIVGTPRDLS